MRTVAVQQFTHLAGKVILGKEDRIVAGRGFDPAAADIMSS